MQYLSRKNLTKIAECAIIWRGEFETILTLIKTMENKNAKKQKARPLPLRGGIDRGNLPDLDGVPVVGVVGTRSASVYGLNTAKQLGYEIGLCGGIVFHAPR